MGDLSKHFSKVEFVCQCIYVDCNCKDGEQISKDLIKNLENVRELFGNPITITSGLRCEAHNKAVGGSPDSAHTKGLAVDILCKNSRYRSHLLPLLWNRFKRIGIHKDFIHVDVDKSKDTDVVWVY